jgi:general stress protein 26
MEPSNLPADDYPKLKELVEEIRTTMMTTADADGTLRSRPLQTLRYGEDGALWFFTSKRAAKIAGAAADASRVNLSYANLTKHDYVSISGRATLLQDRKLMEGLWSEGVELFFPQGINDPDLALLRVDIDKAEYWDGSGSAIGREYPLPKAVATGKKDATGKNLKVAASAAR